ncbi:hypothetical protein CPC735_004140 [Coccidioides posadasii C735 delta SOWgp]|uniref:Uncharacterized protein n=1 Tax=Coccidioides posadasii (strain C735) TaxID=222929 RepID=C5P931_COCP7|nr:hypothetical protein CPC735_004140 [Coccidioides posadasii C735 delta SOWgp]EER26243.1 hypothetical protein CPC735_004140 [Coccidioides posadasii C735 delta SOWgp]|eukprot:XP_003068388.1 hypothetical protein CPC735_004140 [Coccidioides posadasii C735 delta SOWgp]
METAIRWAPASTPDDQRFLYVDIKGQEFKHCKVTSRPDKFTLTYDVLSAFSHGSEFRSFDWCPTEENLVAVGHASGDVVVAHLDTGALIPLALPSKVQRACHGLAWNSSGLLAAGLDKFRGDYCLNIWDPHQRPVRMASRGGSERQVPDPLRRYANGEPVASVRFFNDQPSLLIAGMKGHSVRLYDLRESHGNPSLQFSTRCVHELTVNRLDENYFASCAPFDNASICIWDRRSGSRYSTAAGTSSGTIDAGHVLEIRPGIASGSTIQSLRFSQTQRGRLGMLTDRGIFRAYHIAKDHSPDELRAALEKTVGRGSSKHYPEQLYTKTVRDFQTSFPPKTRSEDSSQRVSAFDFMTTDPFDGLEAITILNDRNVAVYSLPLVCGRVSLSPQGALVRGGFAHGQDFRVFAPAQGSKAAQATQEIQDRASKKMESTMEGKEANGKAGEDGGKDSGGTGIISSRQRREKLLLPEKLANVQDALTLMTIPRLRLREGYTLNPERNQNIVSDDTALQDLWAWIERAHTRASDGSMIIHGVDMNYLGVQSIWSGNLGLSLENRLASSDLDDDVDVPKLIEQLAKKLNLQETKMCDTDFMPQRQLCLYICGAIASVDDLEGVVTQLVEERQHTQAAAFALFHDETELAYKALRNNRPTQAHKLLAMAIAGAPRGDPNFDWEEACAEIAKELTDPFAKAILALVSKGSWESVLRETTLPLRYRVEVAVRWLPDDQLTTYIRDTSMEAVQQGDIEGAVLTGLDHAAMDLFQSYINKFNDIQTAVLVMNYAVPRLVSDAFNANRFHAWRETYRQQMNSWKMHLHRAKFDVDSRNLAVSWDGRKLTRSQPQQVSLVCNYCTRPLSQQEERPDHQLAGAESTHHTPNNPLGSAQMGGTVCPKCGRHMPRCGVCSLWLGSPHPLSRAAIADDSKKGEEAHRPEEMLKRFVVFCIKCNHGYHADHAKVWFSRHKSCPVSECGCICEG